MNVQQFTRKSFPVEAVQVTATNMEEIATWCNGDIRTEEGVRYIKVRVHQPINERQTKAFVNDWVLYAGKGYKVYKDAAFSKSFERGGEAEDTANVFDIKENTFEGEGDPTSMVVSSTASNPGGTTSV